MHIPTVRSSSSGTIGTVQPSGSRVAVNWPIVTIGSTRTVWNMMKLLQLFASCIAGLVRMLPSLHNQHTFFPIISVLLLLVSFQLSCIILYIFHTPQSGLFRFPSTLLRAPKYSLSHHCLICSNHMPYLLWPCPLISAVRPQGFT